MKKTTKKRIWKINHLVFLISLLVYLGCGSRKRELNKGSEKTSFENTASGNSETKFENVNFHEGSLSQLLENQNLKITSNGTPYQLQYGNLVFSGSADIEFSNQKQDVKKQVKNYSKTTCYSKTTYQTQTNYQTQTTYKTVKTERSGISFGNIIWIVIISFCAGAITVPVLKKYIPVWISGFFKRK